MAMRIKARGALSSVQSGVCGAYAAEMIFFLFKISESMLEPSVRLFMYEGICLQELDSHHKCKYLQRYPDQEAIVQNKSAQFIMYYKILLNAPAVLLVLFCGAWSDRSGRKLPVMLTSFGGIVSVLLYMLSSQLGGGKGPMLPLILFGAAIRGSFGRSAVMTMACHSYVSDISTRVNRTRKLGHLVAMSHFGYLTGSTVAGSLLDTTGFVVVFCIVVFIQTTCFLVASVCMRETVVFPDVGKLKSPNDGSSNSEEVSPQADCELCDANLLRSCFQVISKPRRGKVQCFIVTLFIVSIIQQTCKSGETDITLLYVERAPLSWMRSLYSYLLALDYACLGIMGFFVLPPLIRFCRLSDCTLALTGVVFKIARTLFLAFSTQTWMVYAAVAIGGPHAFTIAGIKSMISKLVDEDEIGKTFSIISSLETISNLFGTVIFTNVYAVSLGLWPGLSYALEAGLYLVLFLLLVVMACMGMTRQDEQDERLVGSREPESGPDNPEPSVTDNTEPSVTVTGTQAGPVSTTTYGTCPVDTTTYGTCPVDTTTYGTCPVDNTTYGTYPSNLGTLRVPTPAIRASRRQDSLTSDVVYSYDFESSGCVNTPEV